MKTILHKAVVGVQPSAGTSFDLLPTAGQVTFSWDQPTINKKEDKFFKVEGKLMDEPKSTILISSSDK